MCAKIIDRVGQTQGKSHEYVHYTYVCVVNHLGQNINHLGKVVNPALKSAEQRKRFFLCPRPRLRIWSREIGSAVPLSATTASFYMLPTAIGPVSSLSGHANAYRDGVYCREAAGAEPVV